MFRFGLALSALVLAACAPARPQRPPEASSREAPEAAPAEVVDSVPRLQLTLKPVARSTQVQVAVTADGTQDQLSRWTLSRQALVSELSAHDRSGDVPLEQHGLEVVFRRAVDSPLTIRYVVSAGAFSVDAPQRTALDPNHFRGSGESLLLLPAAFEQQPVPVHLRIDAADLGPDASGASSLGWSSEEDMELSARALRRATFLAGQLGRARFDAPEGIDRAAWLGFTSFDPRQVAAEVAGFRTGARQYFNANSAPPLTLLLVSDGRRPGRFDVARRTASLLVHVGVAQAWDAPLRLAVYPQVLREWIGSELSIAPLDEGDPVEPAWFVDGMSRHLARELGFRFGLLTPAENAEEVEHLLALYATSPYKKTPLHSLKSQPDRDAALTQAVVRGALYALLLDARLRDKSGGKRSLDDLLRTLFEEARKAQAPLSPRAFTDAVSETLGEQALTLDQRTLRGDTPIVLPANALGHCFAPRKQTVTPFVLGLTESADETGRTTVQHAAGPAAAAGLHDGDEIRGLVYQPGDPRVKVRLEAKRDGGWHKLSYLPAGKPIAVQGFVKKPGLSDDDCLQRDPSTR